MFGNLIRECGVLDSLSQSAQHELANLITLLLGLSVAFRMKAELFEMCIRDRSIWCARACGCTAATAGPTT